MSIFHRHWNRNRFGAFGKQIAQTVGELLQFGQVEIALVLQNTVVRASNRALVAVVRAQIEFIIVSDNLLVVYQSTRVHVVRLTGL